MGATTPAVSSATVTVYYSTCVTSKALTATATKTVTVNYGASNNLNFGSVGSPNYQLIGSPGSGSPFTTTNGFCPDITCSLVSPKVGQAIVWSTSGATLTHNTNSSTPILAAAKDTLTVWCKSSAQPYFAVSVVTFVQTNDIKRNPLATENYRIKQSTTTDFVIAINNVVNTLFMGDLSAAPYECTTDKAISIAKFESGNLMIAGIILGQT